MKKHILLFACVEKNIGDDLFVYTLCNRYPNINFDITYDAKYGSLKSLQNLNFKKSIKYWIILENAHPKNKIKKCILNILKFILLKLIGKYDTAVYIVGNAFKNTKYLGWEQSSWIRDRINLANHFFLLSTNFGPFENKKWLEDFKIIFKNVDDICFRDKKSYNLFKNLPNVRFAPDAILSFRYKNEKTKQTKKRLIISIIDCSNKIRPKKLNDVCQKYENKIVDIIEEYKKHDYEIIIFNFNSVQDNPASNRIKKCIRDVKIYDYDGDLDQALKLFSTADAVIATRLHSFILSLDFNIPVFPIIYDEKVDNIINSYNYKGPSINIENIDSLNVQLLFKELEKKRKYIDKKIFDDSNKQFYYLDKYIGSEFTYEKSKAQ